MDKIEALETLSPEKKKDPYQAYLEELDLIDEEEIEEATEDQAAAFAANHYLFTLPTRPPSLSPRLIIALLPTTIPPVTQVFFAALFLFLPSKTSPSDRRRQEEKKQHQIKDNTLYRDAIRTDIKLSERKYQAKKLSTKAFIKSL